jgi:signal transduction histidine kinase
MDFFQVSTIGALAGTLSILLIYIYLYGLYRERCIGMWVISWTVFLSRVALFDSGFSNWEDSILAAITYQLLYVACDFLFIYSAYLFINQPLKKYWIYGTGMTVILSIGITIMQLATGYKLAPPAWFGCLICLYIGISFIRIKTHGAGKYIAGYAFVIWGFFTLVTPFFISNNNAFCWISLCCEISHLLITSGTLMVYFEKTRAELITKEEHFQSVQQANQELNHFCHSIAHDFKGSLLSINQLAKHLTLKYSDPLNSTGKEFLSHIQDKSAEVITMTNHLLELSRISQKELQTEPIPLELLFRQVYKELKGLQPKRQVAFILKPLPCIYGDPILIQIMVSNILSNALKYTSIRQQAIIEVSCEEKENDYVISVKDNGAGFNMHYSGKLFKIFERLHSVDKFEGTGVGLVVCQRILTRHHGHAWLTGKEEEGAIFSFRFPKVIPKHSSSPLSILTDVNEFVSHQ